MVIYTKTWETIVAIKGYDGELEEVILNIVFCLHLSNLNLRFIRLLERQTVNAERTEKQNPRRTELTSQGLESEHQGAVKFQNADLDSKNVGTLPFILPYCFLKFNIILYWEQVRSLNYVKACDRGQILILLCKNLK